MSKSKKPKLQYSLIDLEIINYSASVDASINYEVANPRRCYGDEKVYNFSSSLKIEAKCVYPEEQLGHTYIFSVYGVDHDIGGRCMKSLTLNECRKKDEYNSVIYKQVRGESVPEYDIPKSVGMIEKARGENHWSGTVWVQPNTVDTMLTLLTAVKPLYISLHQFKLDRHYWIKGFTLQMEKPE